MHKHDATDMDAVAARKRRLARKEQLVGLGVFVLFAGMLFWTKLRVVQDLPRSAYAEPKLVERPTSEDAPVDAVSGEVHAHVDETDLVGE